MLSSQIKSGRSSLADLICRHAGDTSTAADTTYIPVAPNAGAGLPHGSEHIRGGEAGPCNV